MEIRLDPEIAISCLSLLLTGYFWLVRVRKERPKLEFIQLSDFRSSLRRIPERVDVRSFGLQQLQPGGVLIVNHSLRQNSVVVFECFLATESGLIEGEWGYGGDDAPPWNIGPESSLAFSPACFFEVPKDFEEPDNLVLYLRFRTASGRKFTKRFTKKSKSHSVGSEPLRVRDAA